MILTRGDLARITAATGTDGFHDQVYYPDLSFLRAYDYDPNWRRYSVLPGNLRRQLRVRPDGACVFLTAAGCPLAMDVRPLMCRLYPYDYSEAGLRGICSGDDLACPVDLLQPDESLDQIAGAPPDRIEEWRAQFYRELQQEYQDRPA